MKPVKKILTALDFSEHSQVTLEHATHWARLVGAELVVISVINQRDVDAIQTANRYVDIPEMDDYVDKLRQGREEMLDQCASDSVCQGLSLQLLAPVGLPSREILKAIKETGCDLVVMGTQGHGAVSGALFGSVATRVVRRSPVPVMVVPMAVAA